MVSSILSLTRSGVKDFFVQRVTALILLLYVFFMVGVILSHEHLTYLAWRNLFDRPWVTIFSFLALLSMIAHAWVGIWTILTDYVHNAVVRGLIQTLFIIGFIACIVWGIWILWS